MFSPLLRWLKTQPGKFAVAGYMILSFLPNFLSGDSGFIRFLFWMLMAVIWLPSFCFMALVLPHYAYGTAREWVHRRRAGLRFLCPSCLHFWDYYFTCHACGQRVGSLKLNTGGIWDNECSECREPLFSQGLKLESKIQVVCDNCQQSCDPHVHGQRRVRVLATLRADDFAELCHAAAVSPQRARHVAVSRHQWQFNLPIFTQHEQSDQRGLRLAGASGGDWSDRDRNFAFRPSDTERLWRRGMQFAVLDDGQCLTYVLCCDDEWRPEKFVALQHALRHIEAIWLDAENISPLKLGQAIDRFIRHSGLAEAKEPAIKVCVPQTRLDPVVSSRLETLLGRISHGVAAADFLSPGTAAASTQPALADSSVSPETVAAEFASAQRQKEFQEP